MQTGQWFPEDYIDGRHGGSTKQNLYDSWLMGYIYYTQTQVAHKDIITESICRPFVEKKNEIKVVQLW